MIGLYFGGKQFITKFGNSVGNLELDAVLDESHEWQADATTNPVEGGAPITDHVIEQPDKVRIRGFVSETPLASSASGRALTGWDESITQPVFDLLQRLIKAREVITVYTKYKIYTEMILINLTIPRSATTGDALEFTAEFINIRKVATQTVDVPAGISAKKDKKATAALGKKAEPQKDTGKKQGVQKSSSALSRLF